MAEKPQLAQSPYLNLDAGYTQAFDYSGDNVVYQGWAVPGTAKSTAGWRICKLTYDGSSHVTDIQWAGAGEQFKWIWNDRASLSYS